MVARGVVGNGLLEAAEDVIVVGVAVGGLRVGMTCVRVGEAVAAVRNDEA